MAVLEDDARQSDLGELEAVRSCDGYLAELIKVSLVRRRVLTAYRRLRPNRISPGREDTACRLQPDVLLRCSTCKLESDGIHEHVLFIDRSLSSVYGTMSDRKPYARQ